MKLKGIELLNERNEETIEICKEILERKNCSSIQARMSCKRCCFYRKDNSKGCAYVGIFGYSCVNSKCFEEICKLYLSSCVKQEEMDV